MFKNWLRVLYVKFYNANNGKYYIVGKTTDDSKRLRISINGSKYLSAVKDNFTIAIYNMTYKECITILQEELYNVQIFAGYRNDEIDPNGKCLFDGTMINISNAKKDYKDNVFYIVCASKVVGSANQYRLNLSLNSNINTYSAIKWVMAKSNIASLNISDDFKLKFFKDVQDATSSGSNYLEQISNSNTSTMINCDSSNGKSSVNVWDINTTDSRKYNIDISKGMIIGDAPNLTSNGLIWESLPVMNYMCGDTIVMDNSYINLSSGYTSYSSTISTYNTSYLDTNGLYIIMQLDYNLDNYGDSGFQVRITAKAKSLFSNLVGE